LKDWIKLYESTAPWQAEIVKALLESHEIPAILMNQRDSSYQLFGAAAVWVHQNDRQTAEALVLSSFEEEESPADE
jgi:hypothetical protein